MAPTVFTIGHSSQPVEQLIALLQRHGISQLADVRSAPASRFAPQFNRPALTDSLGQAGIDYRWLGQALGGKPRAAAPVFAAGIADLLALAEIRPTAIMCAERDPLHCHRTHLVTPALLKNGAAVIHILSDGGLLPHAALQQPPKQQDLFG
ncbi:MAG: DUF488 domain-containing protein [Ferrovibrio sp.]|uniref:DUF488 domain-containing protein n=1 Tax=Ferrovibrio sp. TaxID=1917215 RepID=UPI002619AC0C|nr:DUF488 domain-containing protein [Ferrovibrio sp.]MCW0235971.1 DUF488 domain-containing protein [Ferrovibrio sp.]